MQTPSKSTKRAQQGLALLVMFFLSHLALADDRLIEARTLIQAGKTQTAYLLLESLESERAGDAAYDYLLGIAAIDSGHNTRGVFALERVLAVEPNNARARAEIARAYLALGETATARQEFNTVKKQDIPDEVARTIDHYLDAVNRIDFATRTTIRGYAEATIGHDNNVNVGPNRNSVAIPGFGNLPFTLSKDSKANPDMFGTLGAGLNLRHPLTPNLALTAGLSGWQRMNFTRPKFDTANTDVNLGLVFNQERNTFSLTAQHNEFWLDDQGFRSATGITGQWQYNLNSHNQFSTFIQYSDLDYDQQSIRNADRWVYGGAYAHALKTGEVIFASLYGVQEKEKARNVPFLGYEGFGFRAGAQTSSSKALMYFGSVSLEQRHYGGDDPAFLKTRVDTQYDLNLGATYRIDRDWSVTPRVTYTKNDSNADLNDYHREVVSVTLRRDF